AGVDAEDRTMVTVHNEPPLRLQLLKAPHEREFLVRLVHECISRSRLFWESLSVLNRGVLSPPPLVDEYATLMNYQQCTGNDHPATAGRRRSRGDTPSCHPSLNLSTWSISRGAIALFIADRKRVNSRRR